jgi:hypothetical protein
MPTTIRFTGDDKDLTLDELGAFVKSARQAGVPGDNPVRADLSTSGKIAAVEVLLDDDRS